MAFATLGIVSIIGMLIYYFVAPPSPETICRLALTAIDRRDPKALLRLSSPEELRRVNLNEATVTALLSETFWKSGTPDMASAAVERAAGMPVDRAVFTVDPKDVVPSGQSAFFVFVTDSRDIGWRLNLSALFFSFCRDRAKVDSRGRMDYVEICRKHGILGVQDSKTQFFDLSRIERKAQEFAAQGK
jgi:hypothetical protein